MCDNPSPAFLASVSSSNGVAPGPGLVQQCLALLLLYAIDRAVEPIEMDVSSG